AVTRALEMNGYQYQIESWDAETGKLLFQRPFEGDQGSDLTPDGRGVSRQTRQGVVIEEPATGRPLVQFDGELSDFCSYSCDGKVVALPRFGPYMMVSEDANGKIPGGNPVVVWETASGKPVGQIDAQTPAFTALSPEGRLLAAGNAGGIRVWDLISGKEIFQRLRRSRAGA